MCELKILIW